MAKAIIDLPDPQISELENFSDQLEPIPNVTGCIDRLPESDHGNAYTKIISQYAG